MHRRTGFTFVELLVAMTVIGILSSVALPKFRDARRRATATQIIGDFDVVRHAALSFYADSGYYPVDARSGQMPRNLERYLPTGFQMQKPQWSMDYQNWSGWGRTVIAVSFTTSDPKLGQAAVRLMRGAVTQTFGSTYTFFVTGL